MYKHTQAHVTCVYTCTHSHPHLHSCTRMRLYAHTCTCRHMTHARCGRRYCTPKRASRHHASKKCDFYFKRYIKSEFRVCMRDPGTACLGMGRKGLGAKPCVPVGPSRASGNPPSLQDRRLRSCGTVAQLHYIIQCKCAQSTRSQGHLWTRGSISGRFRGLGGPS